MYPGHGPSIPKATSTTNLTEKRKVQAGRVEILGLAEAAVRAISVSFIRQVTTLLAGAIGNRKWNEPGDSLGKT